jgi:hypothetical protein
MACASGEDATSSTPWQPADTEAGSSGGMAAEASSDAHASTSGGEDPPEATTDATGGPGCLDASDCLPGFVCDDGACVSEPDETSGGMCLPATEPCQADAECCGDLLCGSTSLGQTCCGWEGEPCSTENGEDCCGNLLCVDGACGYDVQNSCASPCTNSQPPALRREHLRLDNIGGSFLGICGDANHTYGYHVPAALLPSSDYSMEGAANVPVCDWHAAAIDLGMDWPASREWLMWLIEQIQTDAIQGIAEVIGSYDGVNVRYWSDSSGWSTEGVEYQGSGHDSWTHVAVYRSTTLDDHGILAGWTADGMLP